MTRTRFRLLQDILTIYTSLKGRVVSIIPRTYAMWYYALMPKPRLAKYLGHCLIGPSRCWCFLPLQRLGAHLVYLRSLTIQTWSISTMLEHF